MLRTRLDMSRLAGRLFLQVAVSVTATLIGSALFAALPRLSLPGPSPAAELTSGGKYAARIPGVASDPVVTADPVESVSPAPVASATPSLAQPVAADALPALRTLAVTPAAELAWSDDALLPTLDKPAHAKRRTGIVRPVANIVQAGISVRPAGDAVALVADDGLLTKAVSSARSLWSLSASAGGALLSHLTP